MQVTKTAHLTVLTLLLGAIVVSGQDSIKPCEYEFSQLKDAVHRVTSQHIYTGSDVKAFNRSGDMVAVAIVKTIPESELTSPTMVKDTLTILREAFACPSRCIAVQNNRQPNVTMLLLEHLRMGASGPIQTEIDQIKDFISQQTKDVK